MTGSLDPFKNISKIDLDNTFDTHISSNSNTENRKLFEKEVVKSGNNISAGEVIEKTLKYKVSLREYIINQINRNFNCKDNKTVAMGMIDYLHPSGWFINSTTEVAEDLNVEISVVEKTLRKLKTLEPVGILPRI